MSTDQGTGEKALLRFAIGGSRVVDVDQLGGWPLPPWIAIVNGKIIGIGPTATPEGRQWYRDMFRARVYRKVGETSLAEPVAGQLRDAVYELEEG